ncbi:PucR family transcriptional regulator [Amycolatopsis sp. NPDC051903]|uniref:PucR family transcriptional regulator n=1 Tax=Amycolatopsis sp. NPDC051903 TaxID=3363936 RepID=UPI00379AD014
MCGSSGEADEPIPAARSGAGRRTHPELSRLANRLAGQADPLARRLAAVFREEIPFYRPASADPEQQVLNSLRVNLRSVFLALGIGRLPDTGAAYATGEARARADVPLAAVLQASLLSTRFIWQALVDENRAGGAVPDGELLDAGAAVWEVVHHVTQAAVEGYREHQATRILAREHERSALLRALLEGRLTWPITPREAAEILGVGLQGSYVVVAAGLAQPGRRSLPGIDATLASLGIRSAWLVLPEVQAGIVAVPDEARRRELVDALRAEATGPIGVSPPFDDPAAAAPALQLANVALAATLRERGLVTVFDDDAFAVTAVAAAPVTGRAADRVLAGLDAARPEEQDLLLRTFLAWVAHDGQVARTAEELSCHANTIRRRLRRFESYTGKSLAKPRDLAELCLAVEVRIRRAPAAGGHAQPTTPPAGTVDRLIG